jgi:tripartite-type tricarboxylate transporter receptor subunit TctC
MTDLDRLITRRRVLAAGGTALGAAALGGAFGSFGGQARAQSFPSGTVDVVIPTREGGGADRLYRAFTSVWKDKLGTDFEVGFFPEGSGRAGYEVYINRRDKDPHNLLFGNMGPELAVMVVQNASYSFPEDFQYFLRLDTDPSVLFVRADGPFQTIDDVIAEGKKRTLSVATSRLPHPASIGALLLGEETGAQFNLIPLSGGRNTIAGVVTGETDIGVLPSGSVVSAGDAVRALLVWDDKNPIPDQLANAPTMNGHFGTDAPPLVSSRAFGIHSSTIEDAPDAFAKLVETGKAAFDDPAFAEAAEKANQPLEILDYGGLEECNAAAESMIELAQRYKDLLAGNA